MNLNICFSPALFPYYHTQNTIVVVVDIFRATTSICTAFQNGAFSVKTLSNLEEAMDFKKRGYLVAAERNTQKCDFADFGNSPFEFKKELVVGKNIIFTTTNGTQAVEAAVNASEIILGAFSNISAVKDYCAASAKNILILCSGWNNRFCMEDMLFSGALADMLIKSNKFTSNSDAVNSAIKMWENSKFNLLEVIKTTEHYQRLEKNELTDSVEFCLTQDTTKIIPHFDKESTKFMAAKII